MQRETYLELSRCEISEFKSTPSMQRETAGIFYPSHAFVRLNPLPLCRGRLQCANTGRFLFMFKSTPSMQRETLPVNAVFTSIYV